MANEMSIFNYLEAGIQAEGARQKAIANNVANLNSPGYKRTDIKFEEMLQKAMASKGDVKLDDLVPEYYRPENSPVKANGNDVELDMEIGQMVKNSLRHKTFMLLLKKKYQQMNEAIRVQ